MTFQITAFSALTVSYGYYFTNLVCTGIPRMFFNWVVNKKTRVHLSQIYGILCYGKI